MNPAFEIGRGIRKNGLANQCPEQAIKARKPVCPSCTNSLILLPSIFNKPPVFQQNVNAAAKRLPSQQNRCRFRLSTGKLGCQFFPCVYSKSGKVQEGSTVELVGNESNNPKGKAEPSPVLLCYSNRSCNFPAKSRILPSTFSIPFSKEPGDLKISRN
jgi:hypothetical protein